MSEKLKKSTTNIIRAEPRKETSTGGCEIQLLPVI
jgi:hypothetical protein